MSPQYLCGSSINADNVTVRVEVSYRTVTFRNVYYQAGVAEGYFSPDERILHRVHTASTTCSPLVNEKVRERSDICGIVR